MTDPKRYLDKVRAFDRRHPHRACGTILGAAGTVLRLERADQSGWSLHTRAVSELEDSVDGTAFKPRDVVYCLSQNESSDA